MVVDIRAIRDPRSRSLLAISESGVGETPARALEYRLAATSGIGRLAAADILDSDRDAVLRTRSLYTPFEDGLPLTLGIAREIQRVDIQCLSMSDVHLRGQTTTPLLFGGEAHTPSARPWLVEPKPGGDSVMALPSLLCEGSGLESFLGSHASLSHLVHRSLQAYLGLWAPSAVVNSAFIEGQMESPTSIQPVTMLRRILRDMGMEPEYPLDNIRMDLLRLRNTHLFMAEQLCAEAAILIQRRYSAYGRSLCRLPATSQRLEAGLKRAEREFGGLKVGPETTRQVLDRFRRWGFLQIGGGTPRTYIMSEAGSEMATRVYAPLLEEVGLLDDVVLMADLASKSSPEPSS